MKHMLMLAALLPVTAIAADDSREFSLDVPAADIERLELEANVGEVDIRAADIDVVEVRVRLEPGDGDWFDSADRLAKRLAEAKLEQEIDDEALRLRLDYDESRRGDENLEEHWEIRIPARLALDVELNVGQARLEGAAGGVDAEVNVGELEIDVPAGSIDAEVNVGEIDIRSATKSPGEFDLESNIGDARLAIDGRTVGTTEGWLGRGVRHDADGDDNVNAHVNVGEVRVEIR